MRGVILHLAKSGEWSLATAPSIGPAFTEVYTGIYTEIHK